MKMENKEIKKFVCRKLLEKNGRDRRRCYKNLDKTIDTTRAIITIVNLF